MLSIKRIFAAVLLLSLLLSLAACGGSDEVRDISCEEIISAYEAAGYYVVHGEHRENGSTQICYIKASISEEDGSDYIYFTTHLTEESALEAEKTDRYNLAVWLIAALQGEGRWLKSDTFGKIEYSYYNSDLILPFRELQG